MSKMIAVKDVSLCCGCAACVQACPQGSITLQVDAEGFLYPSVDMERCVQCGVCKEVCPSLHSKNGRYGVCMYAAVNPDENVRRLSSSGGIFSLLAEKVLKEGGVVFGARFDEHWDVVHDYTESLEGLAAFRGSKYVQSRIGNTYVEARQFLRAGRKVLFSGTPCQVKGLKQYLRKEYDNLLTVDFVCHGVPSPKVWHKYLDEELARQCEKIQLRPTLFPSLSERDTLVKDISFRSKALGWKEYSFVLTLSKAIATGEGNTVSSSCIFYDNAYMQAFLANLSLRPSCYNCSAKAGIPGSDITLGDFWGIEEIDPAMDDDGGTSLVFVYTERGRQAFNNSGLHLKAESFTEAVLRRNPSILSSVQKPPYRSLFMEVLIDRGFYAACERVLSTAFLARIQRRIWLLLHRQ